uniref:C2 domain-containing protein n=2 Tax=Clytia hemisphaerica TaxID=252671 RepID=A0A7M5X2K6_9CNID
MGRTSLDLDSLEKEKSHYVELNLEDQPGVLCLHISITALNNEGSASDIKIHNDDSLRVKEIENDFSLLKTTKAMSQVGWMQLKLHRASNLAAKDIGGQSDPFAVIELGNQRLVTPTIYKTLNPQWDKVYELPVYDIHEVLEITVFDEDKRGAPEFLGRVQIPLLSISSWERRLFQLKDKRLQAQAKGHLIMTLGVVYNPIRASLRTVNPREERVLDEAPRFRRQLLQKNVDRITNLIRSIIATGEFIQSLFTWKFRLRSAFAFTIYILLVMNFDAFMLPLILFLVLLKNYIVFMLAPNKQSQEEEELDEDDDDDDDDEKNKKGRSKTFREKLEAINNICTLVQNKMDDVASFGERIKNTFNWSVPFLSYLLMVILLLGTVVLYIVPIRYLLLAWGVNKFTKRIRKPNAIPNNELLDFLSRVPSDPEVKKRRPLKTDVVLR